MKQRALIVLLLLVPAPSVGTAAAMFWWPELALGKTVFLAAKIWLVLLPLLWLRLVDRERLSWSPPRRGGFGVAAVLGVVLALVGLAVFATLRHLGAVDAGKVVESAARTGLNQPGAYLAGALYWITINSLLEEYVWRWFVFRKCEVLLGGTAGVIAASLAFTAHHVVALTAQFDGHLALLASLGVFMGGAAWSWLYLRYRSIWPGYVSHAIVDAAIFAVGYGLIFGRG